MFEGQPRLISEASAYGIPSIYPSFGGLDEYFPEDYKLSFKQFDYENVVYCENLKEMLEEYIVLPSTSVISRARAEEVGWFDESLWGREDIDFYIRLAGENYGGEFIDKFGCIALWSTDGTKIDDFHEKDKLSGDILYSKHPDFNFEILREQINRRYVLIFDDNDEQYPNESVIDLCVETLPFNLSDANRLIQR